MYFLQPPPSRRADSKDRPGSVRSSSQHDKSDKSKQKQSAKTKKVGSPEQLILSVFFSLLFLLSFLSLFLSFFLSFCLSFFLSFFYIFICFILSSFNLQLFCLNLFSSSSFLYVHLLIVTLFIQVLSIFPFFSSYSFF